jgi:hypothetical protein
MTATPGSILPGGIILIDEPAFAGVTTFVANGEVLLTFNMRPGADFGQIIMGMTPHQTLQLIERLQAHADVCARAVAEGKGGARFPEKAAE